MIEVPGLVGHFVFHHSQLQIEQRLGRDLGEELANASALKGRGPPVTEKPSAI
ncbi:MAG: hypothetical protein HYY04_11075 [Chloroflexi bacterium]|nr:hypothetical protein [Chloroflexota bacterium]